METEQKEKKSIEYRYIVESGVGVGCNYVLEIKNAGSDKIKGVLYLNYTTLLFPTSMKKKTKFSINGGETEAVKFQIEGCKKKDKEATSFQSCANCSFDYRMELD